MPELDGLGVAAALPTGRPDIVFVTAFDEYAVKAFELAAVDYLVKPVRKERLEAAVSRVRARANGPDRQDRQHELRHVLERLEQGRAAQRMAVRCGARFAVFDPARVCAIVAKDHYSAILVDDKELLADDPLDTLERRFDGRQFLRVHRGAIVNLACVRELVHEGDRRYVAVLTDPAATRVAISRERLPAVKGALGIE
jgi:DNA-binding LytR/AlgR family response regulator